MLRRCLIRWMNLALILVLRFLLFISKSNPRPQVDLIRSEAKVPDAGPRGRHRIHDEEREEAFRGCACQRVQHLLGSLHLVHIQVHRPWPCANIQHLLLAQGAGSSEEGKTVEPVCAWKHNAGLNNSPHQSWNPYILSSRNFLRNADEVATLTGSDYLDDLLTVRNFANSELVVAFSGVMTGCPSPWCTHRCSHGHCEVQNHWHDHWLMMLILFFFVFLIQHTTQSWHETIWFMWSWTMWLVLIFFHFPLQGGHAGHVRVLHLLPDRSAEVGCARPSVQLPHQISIKQVLIVDHWSFISSIKRCPSIWFSCRLVVNSFPQDADRPRSLLPCLHRSPVLLLHGTPQGAANYPKAWRSQYLMLNKMAEQILCWSWLWLCWSQSQGGGAADQPLWRWRRGLWAQLADRQKHEGATIWKTAHGKAVKKAV